MDHFEYPDPREVYEFLKLVTLHGKEMAPVTKMHTAFSPMRSILDLVRGYLYPTELPKMSQPRYFHNAGV
jgi:hypothetical protein